MLSSSCLGSAFALRASARQPSRDGWLAEPKHARKSGVRRLERETGIEPATNSLEGCDSTTELLPPTRSLTVRCLARRRASSTFALFSSPSRASADRPPTLIQLLVQIRQIPTAETSLQPSLPLDPREGWLATRSSRHVFARPRAKGGGEGRTRTFEAARATDLQSAAFDRFATSPASCVFWKRDVSVVLKKARMFLALQPMELAKGFEPPTC